jgi:hypothetical protein
MSVPPARNPNSGCGTAALAGCGVVVLVFVVVAIIGIIGASTTSQAVHESGRHHAAAATIDWCRRASDMQNLSVKDIEGGSYRSGYDDAVQGLRDNARCDEETTAMVTRGYLLSSKGLSEHYLSVGDSQTDLNEANMLLEKCQTDPELYGTHLAADCETEQQNNIRTSTNWEMSQ